MELETSTELTPDPQLETISVICIGEVLKFLELVSIEFLILDDTLNLLTD